jgi:hypothetical protein
MTRLHRIIVAAFALLSLAHAARAGWYQVDNFEGEAGGRSIRLSLQYYEFGSGITVEGSYYFVAERRPVALYGMKTASGAVLCEISSEAERERILVMGSAKPFDFGNCPLALSFAGDRAKGRWQREGTALTVSLIRTATLDDRNDPRVTGTMDIPFWAQTPTHMFVGRYENTSDGVCMSGVSVVDKASGSVDQVLRADIDTCDAGMLMTQIYRNLERGVEAGREFVWINIRGGGAGRWQDFDFDSATGRFVRAP